MASTIAAPAIQVQGTAAVFTCVGCGHTQAPPRPVLKASAPVRPFDLVRCPDCSLVQQFPRYTPGQLRQLYGADYYVFEEPDEHRWTRAVQQYVLHLLPLEDRLGRRLLDVGCALGHLAALARARGWRVTGIDVSPDAVSRASVRFGLDVRAGSLGRHRETLGPFDAIFLGDCIEHVGEPATLLAEVRRALAPGGAVCIDTPNWAGRWRRWGRGRWLGLNRYHINLFDAESLGRLLESSGFVDIRAAAYTNVRYEAWSTRPELQGRFQWLPRSLAWRIRRWLMSRDSGGSWDRLRIHPPADLEQAQALVRNFAADVDRVRPAPPTAGDNLIMLAHRKPSNVIPRSSSSAR